MLRAFGLLFLLSATMMAGCVTPEGQEDPLIGVCPHWAMRQAPLLRTFDVPADGNVSQDWVPRDAQSGQPSLAGANGTFDRILLEVQKIAFEGQGAHEMVLTAQNGSGRQLLLYEHGVSERPRSLPSVNLGPDSEPRTFDVYLAPVNQNATWVPSPVTLRWDNGPTPATITVKVTLFDRVCGIP